MDFLGTQASDTTQLPAYGLPLLVLDPLLKPSGGHSEDALEPASIDMLFSMQMRCVSFAENQLLSALHNGLCIPSQCLFLPQVVLVGCTHCLGLPVQEPANNYTNQLLLQGIQLQHRRIQEMAHPGLQHQPDIIMTSQDVLQSVKCFL